MRLKVLLVAVLCTSLLLNCTRSRTTTPHDEPNRNGCHDERTILTEELGRRAFKLKSPTLLSPTGRFSDITARDFDGDGNLDLYIAGSGFNRKNDLLFRGSGPVTFLAGEPVPYNSNKGIFSDLDGDGHLDYLFNGNDGNEIFVAYGPLFGQSLGPPSSLFRFPEPRSITAASYALSLFDRDETGTLVLLAVESHLIVARVHPNRTFEIIWETELEGDVLSVNPLQNAAPSTQLSFVALVRIGPDYPGDRFLLKFDLQDGIPTSPHRTDVRASHAISTRLSSALSDDLILATEEGYHIYKAPGEGPLSDPLIVPSGNAFNLSSFSASDAKFLVSNTPDIAELLVWKDGTLTVTNRYQTGLGYLRPAGIDEEGQLLSAILNDYGAFLLRAPVKEEGIGIDLPSVIPTPSLFYDVTALDISGDGIPEIVGTALFDNEVQIVDQSGGLVDSLPVSSPTYLGVRQPQEGVRGLLGISGPDSFHMAAPQPGGKVDFIGNLNVGRAYGISPLEGREGPGFLLTFPALHSLISAYVGADESLHQVVHPIDRFSPGGSTITDFNCNGELDLLLLDFENSRMMVLEGNSKASFTPLEIFPSAKGPLSAVSWDSPRGSIILVAHLPEAKLISYRLDSSGKLERTDSLDLKQYQRDYKMKPRMVHKIGDSCGQNGGWIALGDGGQAIQGRISARGQIHVDETYLPLAVGEPYRFVVADMDGDGVDDLLMLDQDRLRPRVSIWHGSCLDP